MTGKRTLFGAVTLFLALVVAVGAAFAVGNNDADVTEGSTDNVENFDGQLQGLEARIETASLISALNYINAAGFHDMDVQLSEEGEISPRYLSTVEGVITVTDATTWPADLESDVASFRDDLDALAEALANEDVDAAAEASHSIHSSQHALSEATIGYLSGAATVQGDEASSHDDAQLQQLESRVEAAGLISAMNYINAAGFHDMDEALSEGEMNPRYLSTVEGVIAVTNATTWPADLEAAVAEFLSDLDATEAALANEDVDAAAEASHSIHSSQHALSEAALAKLAGAEVPHDEDETDSHDDGDEVEDGHDDAEENGDDGHDDEATSGDAGDNAATLGITDWAFEGDVHVEAGTASLTVTNDGEMPHGIYIPELGVNESVPSGETKTITIDATEHGEYTILCNDPMCGTAEQHGNMMTKLVVE